MPERKTHFKRAFTLIELLVVISIIALLLSILMPSLSKAKQLAKAVVCKSTMRQWALAAIMYTGDNNDSFMKGYSKQGGDDGGYDTDGSGIWFVALEKYADSDKALFCPSATKPMSETSSDNQYSAWGIFDETSWLCAPEVLGKSGSFGFNDWLYDEPENWGWNFGDPKQQLRKNTVKYASEVPMFLDCIWIGRKPEITDEPPRFPNDWSGNGHMMKSYCIDRHEGKINTVFLDMACTQVKLKKLWGLRWHKNYPVNYPPPSFPEWMDIYPD